ncbi:MAG: PAS domain-containing sensor histidine kinase [Desulfobacterium sp.]|nr:PAS domain-containing sensor histidine kinase [Desulfobacterium sp.]
MVVFISLLIVSIYTSNYIQQFFLNNMEKDLMIRSQLIKHQILQYLNPLDQDRMDQFCKRVGASAETRITVILPDGMVIGDSEEDPAKMENHKNRPEILTALEGKSGSSTRKSSTLRIKMMYVALPLFVDNRIVSVVRVSIPITSIISTIEVVQSRVMLVGFFIAVLASVISLFMSRRISRPIEEMRKGAMKFAQGELSHRLHEPSIFELANLASVMNRTAFELEDRIATVKNQRNEYEAVLSSMTEGVVGVDRDQRIITINKAALAMLDADPATTPRGSIYEVSRNSHLNKLIVTAIETGERRQEDVSFFQNGNERILNIKCTVLKNPEDVNIGVLIVLNDVTQLRHLENIRRDFAANVSHEIKTPLTAIKGFVETLRFGGTENAEDSERFLMIIDKHVDRLTAIIDDLMHLSRIERKDESRQINCKIHKMEDLLQSSILHCQSLARERNITVTLTCDPNLTAPIDRTLMEQAMVNLLDNAIKYSEKGSDVIIDTELVKDKIHIHFQDHGIGIEEKHHARLFERFYRVDKARSRKLGGTGLGLAIVKHIVLAHGGDVSVQSKPGQGSRFTISISV